MEEKYYTVKEVAERLGVHVETIRRWIRGGSLPRIALTAKNYRISESDLQKYLSSRLNCPQCHHSASQSS